MTDIDKEQVSKPAHPKIEILDKAPSFIKRPLTLLDGVSYAAAWLYTRIINEIRKYAGSAELPADPSNKVNTPLTYGEFTHEKV